MANLAELIKQTAIKALEASKPVNVIYGTVVSIAPLKVQISEKLTLTGTALVLTAALTDDQGGVALALNDKLLLLRIQGGQHYAVIDRVVTI